MSRPEKRPAPARGAAATRPAGSRKRLGWALGGAAVIALIGITIWLATADTTDTTASPAAPGATADAVDGEQLFTANCAQCHGAAAGGTQSGPPLVHETYVPGHHADGAFLLAVRNGVRSHHWNFGSMPPIPGLSDEDVAHIVAYVRGLQRDAGLIADGS